MKQEIAPPNYYFSWRLISFYAVIALIFGFFIYRLFDLQIIRGGTFLTQADKNRTKEINLPTQRGIIYDRNNFILAQNIASYNIVITPANLPGDTGTIDVDTGDVLDVTASIQEIYRQLGQLIDMPVQPRESSRCNG